jgi:SAM-dependent methyltransferase
MTPAPVPRCRVLELGCGNGANLIPMAYSLPQSRFVGVDLAEKPVAAGARTIARLGLHNISLGVADLRDIGSRYGEFDYIIAHGLYSWIPPDVRDCLLCVCSRRLRPQGIAFVSYNAYPGQHIRQMLRQMVRHHTRNIRAPRSRLEQARWFLRFLRNARTVSQPWQALLDSEVEAALERDDGGLYHDDLAAVNDPVWFRDFAEHARRHGLQYLGEAEPHEMFDHGGSLSWLSGSVIEREQYLDFLKARRFRQTLLCRQGVPLRRRTGPKKMDRFLFSAGGRGVRLEAGDAAVAQVAGALADAHPLPLPFEELLPYAGSREALREILYSMMESGFADLHVYDFPCQETVTPKPAVSRLVRLQAATSATVTNLCHVTVELDQVARRLVTLLDGTRDHAALARAVSAKVRKHLPSSLEWMARMALLEG